MRNVSFSECCNALANERGGFTLWIGAGAAMAQCSGAISWTALTNHLAADLAAPDRWDHLDYPARLEWLASELGHRTFRSKLRRWIVDPMIAGPINEQVVSDQAVIGMRAGTIVSFNIEMASALPFAVGLGGAFVPRPYQPEGSTLAFSSTEPGMVCRPVFFPHGLLDFHGACVLTTSEYLLHGMSLAVGVAVSQCLGGDLVIVGMSLGDTYLRNAILQNRRWIRDIYWIANRFEHAAWAEVARVHCVQASHEKVWNGLAESFLRADRANRGAFQKIVRAQDFDFRQRALMAIGKYKDVISTANEGLNQSMKVVVNDERYPPQELRKVATEYINRGLPLPGLLVHDWRFDAADR